MRNLTYILDIGSSKISLLACIISKNKSAMLTCIDKAYDGFMDGEFFDTEQVEQVIGDLVSNITNQIGKRITEIHIGVPSEFSACVCKRVTRNFVPSKRVLEHELVDLFDGVSDFSQNQDYDVINFSPLQYELDGLASATISNQRISQFVMDCSYILVKKSFIEMMKSIFDKIGIKQVDFVSTSLAQALFIRSQINDPLKSIAIVDVGHITTSVAISKGEGLLMLSSFSLGGGHITADLMQINNLSYHEADAIKHKVCLTVQSKKDEKYIAYANNKQVKAIINITNDIVNSRIENIASVVNKVLSQSSAFEDIPIYLTGDGVCNFRGVINVFEAVCNRKVCIVKSPLHNDDDKYQTSKVSLVKLVKDLV